MRRQKGALSSQSCERRFLAEKPSAAPFFSGVICFQVATDIRVFYTWKPVPPPCKVTGIYEFTGGKLISATVSPGPEPPFKGAELDMLAHLYRGEMYRSSGARDLMRRP